MVIDTTVSFVHKFLDKASSVVLSFSSFSRERNFPWGFYKNKKEHSEFRQLYVREFLERSGEDSDIDLDSTIVFWRNDEIVAVTGFNDSQNIEAILE